MNLKDTTSQLPSLIKSTDIKNNYRYNPFISENYSSMKLGNDINNIKSYLEETESERKLINTKILMKGKEEQIQNINLFNKKRKYNKSSKIRTNASMHLNQVDLFNSNIVKENDWGKLSNVKLNPDNFPEIKIKKTNKTNKYKRTRLSHINHKNA